MLSDSDWLRKTGCVLFETFTAPAPVVVFSNRDPLIRFSKFLRFHICFRFCPVYTKVNDKRK